MTHYLIYSHLNDNHRRNTRIRMIRLSVAKDYNEKISTLKDLDPYDRSGIRKRLDDCKDEEEKKKIVERNERESKNEVKWD
jgi:hypothetical protein